MRAACGRGHVTATGACAHVPPEACITGTVSLSTGYWTGEHARPNIASPSRHTIRDHGGTAVPKHPGTTWSEHTRSPSDRHGADQRRRLLPGLGHPPHASVLARRPHPRRSRTPAENTRRGLLAGTDETGRSGRCRPRAPGVCASRDQRRRLRARPTACPTGAPRRRVPPVAGRPSGRECLRDSHSRRASCPLASPSGFLRPLPGA